jgi:hypothetical protein
MTKTHFALFALALSGSVVAQAMPAVAGQDRFTFHEASFLPPADEMAQARAFVAEAFPPGLPFVEAERRARTADMRCRSKPGGGLACLYAEPQAMEGGLIGEDTWTLRLAPGLGGTVQTAELKHGFVGVDGANPQ